MANVLTCTRTCVDCRTQAAQEGVEVIVDGDSEEEDEGGYWEVRLYTWYSIVIEEAKHSWLAGFFIWIPVNLEWD